VDLGLHRSPQTDVVSHELIIADLAIQEALKGFEILGTEVVVDILPRGAVVGQYTVAVEDYRSDSAHAAVVVWACIVPAKEMG